MSTFRAALAALLMLAAAACGNAAAAPVPPAQGAAQPASSVQLVNRLAAAAATAVPDVTGLPVSRAKAGLTGLQVRVVNFSKKRGGTVSAQWPNPGDPRPADSTVVVWVGEPPVPPRGTRAKAVATPGTRTVATGRVLTLVGDAAAVQRNASGESVPVAPAPSGGVTPGLENMVPPAHGPRANIRTLPPPAPGTALAGRASWYGPGFAGRGTACGTTFDPSELTLASRELRCGTKVLVTAPGGSVEATVTDWGPAEWTERRFDLSQATFEAVASLGSGVIDVTIEVR